MSSQTLLDTPPGFTGVFSVARVTYVNEDTGYAVVHLVPADSPQAASTAAVGQFGHPRVGEVYRIEGVWKRDPVHGPQVEVRSVLREASRSVAAIERYLGGAAIKGVGPVIARALVQHYGANTYDALEAGAPDLEQVPGIGTVRAEQIRQGWAEHRDIHELMVKLQGLAGLSPRQAQRIHQAYGPDAWAVVSQDPYRLAEDLRGYGFRTCDRIARALGLALDAPPRLQAGLLHLQKEALSEGHLWRAPTELCAQATELLGVDANLLPPQLDLLLNEQRLVRETLPDEPSALYLPQIANTEERIAQRLVAWLGQPPQLPLKLTEEQANALTERHAHATLTDEQRRAVAQLLCGARLVTLTGGPGTGKTTTMRSLITCLEALGVSYALCATTGRAAKRLEASTERPAATVHRHLGLGGDQRDVAPIREQVLIIDESSMIDLWLLDAIVARLARRTHLYLVGDVDQLPSVGPGAVLQDLIAATERGRLPRAAVTRLTRIFRQEAGDRSLIVVNCHRVRTGQRPLTDAGKDADYFEMLRDSPEAARDLAISLVTERLPRYLGVPPAEIQLLAPMHRGAAGIAALNQALQLTLNPPDPGKAEVTLRGPARGSSAADQDEPRVFRVGDKVRQTRNNYGKQALNGDLGLIERIDAPTHTLTVRYPDHSVTYDYDELDELVHSWAMTVHAAQGSQWPAVVTLMLNQHYVMLERNILYTALSRAERLAVLITQEQAVRMAVAQDRSTQRRTGLIARLERQPAAGLSVASPDTVDPRTPALF
ncbi:MAG: ATP-dependent RecD-like DNA helicase [Chloroflexi bacterium]|nr:ATP-dependent RecD-like DNA helicase [Chloroflexota bacterium]